MVERMFYCGTDPPARMPKNSKVLRNRGDDPNVKIQPLAISAALVQRVPERLLDLLDIASYVFAADRLTTRGGSSGRGMGSDWCRHLRFRIAVRDPTHWSSPELVLALKDLLAFMSGDDFSFEFEKLERALEAPAYFNFGNGNVDGRRTAPVILFSGGLDSLAGALEELSSTQDRVVLITHRSSPIMTGRQNKLAAELRQRFPDRILYVPLQMTLSGGLNSLEASQRRLSGFHARRTRHSVLRERHHEPKPTNFAAGSGNCSNTLHPSTDIKRDERVSRRGARWALRHR